MEHDKAQAVLELVDDSGGALYLQRRVVDELNERRQVAEAPIDLLHGNEEVVHGCFHVRSLPGRPAQTCHSVANAVAVAAAALQMHERVAVAVGMEEHWHMKEVGCGSFAAKYQDQA